MRGSLETPELSVIVVRGTCASRLRERSAQRVIDQARCNQCGVCLSIGCPAVQAEDGRVVIETALCVGRTCTVCQQVCPRQAIGGPAETHRMKSFGLLVTGVGGQGIILASDIIGEAAMAGGYDVKKTDTIGMAQRGGSVLSHVRLAEKVRSPLIKEGEADLLLAFEKLEAARWANHLRPAAAAIINQYAQPPLAVNLGDEQYPTDAEITALLQKRTAKVYFVDGTAHARQIGDVRTLNMFMLGCAHVANLPGTGGAVDIVDFTGALLEQRRDLGIRRIVLVAEVDRQRRLRVLVDDGDGVRP